MEWKPLTKKKKRAYLKASHRCPYCHVLLVGFKNLEIQGNQVLQEVTCYSCERRWCDIYTLTNMEERIP